MTLKDRLVKARAALRDETSGGHSLFEDMLDQYPDARIDILRERSLGYAELGEFRKAFADRRDVAEADLAGIGDLYFAGEYAIQTGDLEQALLYFDRCIERSINEQGTYYLNSSRLLAALCRSRLGDRVAALALLQEVPSDTSVMWLEGFDDEITKASVLKELTP